MMVFQIFLEERTKICKQEMGLSCDSALTYVEIGSNARCSGNRIQIISGEKVIGANKEYQITYTITIPTIP